MAKRLLVPVNKDGGGIENNVSVLVCYDLHSTLDGKGTGVKANVNVAVVNQFNDPVGDQIMKVGNLKELCVPSTEVLQ